MSRLWPIAAFAALFSGCGQEPQTQDPTTSGTSPPPPDKEITVSVEETLLPGITFHHVDSNGIRMRVADMGEGPVILFAHGWPESWYSWRHQLQGLAAAGFRVLAPDMRGYGETDAPAPVEDYNSVNLAADMVGILDALGIERATMAGHDWGAPVATQTVLLYPDRFNALVLMSVPYGGRGPANPMDGMRAQVGDNFFYMLYHNEEGGVAEAEYDSDPRGLLSRLYQSPDAPREEPQVTDPKRAAGGWIPRIGAPEALPDWLTDADLDYYVSQFENAGFRGGVNYYRNIGHNWELTENTNAEVTVPTLFIAGEEDMVIGGATKEGLEGMMRGVIPDLRGVVLFPGIGHWVQQEAPEETNAAIVKFLGEI